ncbi:MAG TPA: hypothetical protein DCY89_09350 [Gammaproteobacteria bacterium]|nr:hypothetical protein [Gammaproteobacteria bacterium]
MRLTSLLATGLLAAAFLATGTAGAAPVEVTFRALSDQFDIGPFVAGTPVAGRVLLDLDRPRTGALQAPRLIAGVQDARISIGDFTFLADDADLQIVPLSANLMSISARAGGGGQGSVFGSIPGTDYALRELRFEARFPSALFPDRLLDLQLRDFTLLHLVFEFSHPTATLARRSFALSAGEFSSVTAQIVPLPAAVWLFGAATLLPLLRARARANLA